jgi:hypothetical protein
VSHLDRAGLPLGRSHAPQRVAPQHVPRQRATRRGRDAARLRHGAARRQAPTNFTEVTLEGRVVPALANLHACAATHILDPCLAREIAERKEALRLGIPRHQRGRSAWALAAFATRRAAVQRGSQTGCGVC